MQEATKTSPHKQLSDRAVELPAVRDFSNSKSKNIGLQSGDGEGEEAGCSLTRLVITTCIWKMVIISNFLVL